SVMSSASTVTYTSVYTDFEPGRVFWGADKELFDGGGSGGDPEVDHADYPADGGDDDDEPSDDDDDDTDNEDEELIEDEDDDKEEKEEHLALADSSAIPVVDLVPSAGDTEAFETDESAPTPRSPHIRVPFAQTRLRRARKTVKLKPPMSPSIEARIVEYAIPSPPLPVSSSLLPLPPPTIDSPTYAEAPLGYRAVGIRLRASSLSTHHPLHPSLPLPPPPSSLHLPPHVPTSLPLPSSPLLPLPASLFIPLPVDHRKDIPEAGLPPRKRLCLTALTSWYEVGESSTAAPRPTGGHRVDYRFIGTMDAETRRQRAEEVGYGIRDVWVDPRDRACCGSRARHTGYYVVIEDTQDRQTQLFQRVDRLVEDRQFHQEVALLLDQEALASREAWAHSGQLSAVLGQIHALQARDQTHADDREGAASTTVGLVFSFLVSDNHNNMPPRRSSATARVVAAATRAAAVAVATPMTVAAVEQLIEARVSAALANHETLRNSTIG
ncbi:hypothetical protein Tco_0184021, partial [Tanacetum coccineum]